MNTRQLQELRHIAQNGYVSIQDIAARHNVSERTVRYDIDALNDVLYQLLNLHPIEIRQHEARLSNEVARWQIEQALPSGTRDYYQNVVTPQERRLLIVLELCWHETLLTTESLAEEFSVSRSTIVRDIPYVRSYLKQCNIDLDTRRGKGAIISATEEERRSCLARVVRDYGELVGIHSGIEAASYLKWFSAEDVSAISDIVFSAERAVGLPLDDIAFEALVIHIALSLERTKRASDDLRFAPAIHHGKPNNHAQLMAAQILNSVNETFNIKLPDDELCYIETHIMARSNEALRTASLNDAVLEFMCIDLIAEVGNSLGRDLTHDAHLFRCLLQHITGCIYRNNIGLTLSNPLREELANNYASHMQVVEKALRSTGFDTLIPMTNDEVSYVLLHIEAALVRTNNNEPQGANVIVVCSTGYGTAELLAAELQRSFDVNVLACIASHSFTHTIQTTAIDLVVSTVPLTCTLPCVVVRPLLGPEDRKSIQTALESLGYGTSQNNILLKDLGSLARQVARLLICNPNDCNQQELINDLQTLLNQYRTAQHCPEKEGYMLSELLANNHILLDAPAHNWEEAVRISGQPLIETGDITSDYIEAVIQNIQEVGPYVVITKGVALPHATNRVGVQKTAMSFVRLATPVSFGSQDNDPVEFCFMLACQDSTSHLTALTCLATVLATPDSLDILRTAHTPQDVIDFIESFENTPSAKVRGGE